MPTVLNSTRINILSSHLPSSPGLHPRPARAFLCAHTDQLPHEPNLQSLALKFGRDFYHARPTTIYHQFTSQPLSYLKWTSISVLQKSKIQAWVVSLLIGLQEVVKLPIALLNCNPLWIPNWKRAKHLVKASNWLWMEKIVTGSLGSKYIHRTHLSFSPKRRGSNPPKIQGKVSLPLGLHTSSLG